VEVDLRVVELKWQRVEGEGVVMVVFVRKILRFESKVIILMEVKVRGILYCGLGNSNGETH
jgi:hypothetical protein